MISGLMVRDASQERCSSPWGFLFSVAKEPHPEGTPKAAVSKDGRTKTAFCRRLLSQAKLT